ncbi:hypothetical protein PIROE2DRAFT_18589 [Piromyces sp. E2]|nr:hypothetical protein PIROE2DRAFT_18589 [Piromyces sp. E2]|eukprot:OUM56687.1 hypothetical protein PIROE2DRAFT_18589 [Piromyces sp. E2]
MSEPMKISSGGGSGEKKLPDKKSCICRVINSPIDNQQNTLLHKICANSIGNIIKFIFETMNSPDLAYMEDDDGYTPLHILCKRVDELEANMNDFIENPLDNFTSVPSSTNIIKFLKFTSKNFDLSRKNKNNLAPVDLTSNILIHNICYGQIVENVIEPISFSSNIPYVSDWKVLFNLKDTKQKNRTLLHHLCMGDRLNAIRFLVENGADVNVDSMNHKKPINKLFVDYRKIINGYNYIDIKIPAGFKKIPPTITGNSKDIILEKNEQIILEETEKIAEYLVDQGADLDPETYCDFSDIMYRLIKKKKNTNNPEKKPLLKNFSSIVKHITEGLTKYSCFPFGNFFNSVYTDSKNYKKVKFIKIPSISNENTDKEEKLLLLESFN